MAAVHAFQVFWLGFLASADSYEMGVPSGHLGALYSENSWTKWPNVRLCLRHAVESISGAGVRIGGTTHTADYYVSALPFDRSGADGEFEDSPITGIHIWFDRPITNLPHATLLDRTLQWMFNKDAGRYIQLVVSASRSLAPMSRNDVLALF